MDLKNPQRKTAFDKFLLSGLLLFYKSDMDKHLYLYIERKGIMNVVIYNNNNRCLVELRGELDHHNASCARMNIDIAIDSKCPSELYMDFSGVTFMDSSGIGLVMGRYRMLHEYGGTLYIANCSPSISRVMHISGMNKLATFINGDIRSKYFSGLNDMKGETTDEKIRQDIK